MKKIKVYIQYPWRASDSQYYKNMISFPPKGVEYLSNIKKVGIITKKKTFFFSTTMKNFLRRSLEYLKVPIANAWKSPENKDFNLIHCAHCLSKNNFPWVADFEAPWQFWVSGRDTKLGKDKIKNYLINKNCKKIIAWDNQAKESLVKLFPEIKDKIVVVYHALPIPKIRKIKHSGLNILFVARYFYGKGGLHALESINKLTKKYSDVRAFFISETPLNIKKKYEENKKINFMGLIPYEKLTKEIYPLTDLIIYPGYSDTFGFIFTEALSFGIPVITVDGYARNELVEEGKTGFIIKKPQSLNPKLISEKEEAVIKQLIEKTSLLIENRKLRNKMSENGFNKVKSGKFSIKERNKKLERIYSEAMK